MRKVSLPFCQGLNVRYLRMIGAHICSAPQDLFLQRINFFFETQYFPKRVLDMKALEIETYINLRLRKKNVIIKLHGSLSSLLLGSYVCRLKRGSCSCSQLGYVNAPFLSAYWEFS